MNDRAADQDQRGRHDYRGVYLQSLQDPEAFWLDAANTVDWYRPPSRACDDSREPIYHWFPDGELNITVSALDRHVAAGRGDQVALIYDSAVTNTKQRYTYAELHHQVALAAGMLADLGVQHGDRVILYLPMIPQAVIGMLACARLGAVHSVVFGGFSAAEIATRIDDAQPDVLLTASGGIEPTGRVEYLPTVAEALHYANHPVRDVVVHHREGFTTTRDDIVENSSSHRTAAETPPAQWHDWQQLQSAASPAEPVPVAATDPLYILYTSGTTGAPKGVWRDQGGTAVALAWSMPAIFDIGPGETVLTASDVGWVVGHSYIVYAPLITGATTVLYEGKPVGTPDAGAFWRLIQDHQIKTLFTAPTALRAVRKADAEASLLSEFDISSLAYLFVAGERLDPETQRWAGQNLNVPVIDNWWQTETGWPICANPAGMQLLPTKEGSATLPMPGYAIDVLDATGQRCGPGEEGSLGIRLPMPPGTMVSLWGDDSRYREAYLTANPGYYTTGDSGFIDDQGYVYVMGRTDDVINVAGHRLSTGQMEAALAQHPAVAETAVIGLADEVKGQRPFGYVVLKAGVDVEEAALAEELRDLVRRDIGAVAAFKDVAVVPALPKTRSGKILRKTMRQIASGEDYRVPSTIEDASVIDTIAPALRK